MLLVMMMSTYDDNDDDDGYGETVDHGGHDFAVPAGFGARGRLSSTHVHTHFH